MKIRVAVVTVSDRCAAGKQEDLSGAALAEWVSEAGHEMTARETVPDETDRIAQVLCRHADSKSADLVLTTGGTGLAPRDVTPEATRAVLDREAPGISEAIRAAARGSTERAALSRGIAGVRGACLIVNFPGSLGGVKDGISTLAPLLQHAVGILRNEDTDH